MTNLDNITELSNNELNRRCAELLDDLIIKSKRVANNFDRGFYGFDDHRDFVFALKDYEDVISFIKWKESDK